MANTTWLGFSDNKLYLQSGQFTSTLKDSTDVLSIDNFITGVAYDGTDSPWTGLQADKLYLQSGLHTSTLKTSEYVGGVDLQPNDISGDGTNTPWVGSADDKYYLTSGQFTSTIKTSQAVPVGGTDASGISADETNTPACDADTNKQYLISGRFSSTIKTSQDVNAIDNAISAISYTGADTLWSGHTDDKLYMTSGQFTSTLKDSEDISAIDIVPQGIDTSDFNARMNTGDTTGDIPITLPVFTLNGEGTQGEINTSGITLPMFSTAFRAYRGSAPECVVMNTKTFSVSEYINFGFNSYTRFNGADLICDQNGIYEMDTTNLDDSAYKIKAAMKTGRVDTYKQRIQRLRNGWLNYQTDGDTKVVTTANKTKVRTYNLPYKNIENLDEMVERRIKFERGIKDRYFDFKIENIDGANIEVDKLTIMLEPIISKRR